MKKEFPTGEVTFEIFQQAVVEARLEGSMYSTDGFAVCTNANIMLHSLMAYGAPYRLDYNCIGLVTSGSADVTLNLMDYHYEKGTFVYCRDGGILQMRGMSEDFEISVIAYDGEYMRPLYDTEIYKRYLALYQGCVFKLDDSEYRLVSEHFTLIASHMKQELYNREVLSSALSTLVYVGDILCHRKFSPENHPQSRGDEIFHQFIALVNQYSRKESSLDFYAEKLCITVKHLCWTIKRASGKTAKEWIIRARLTDAKELLRRTDNTVVEIADQLGFSQPSTFCTFFKRETGQTPQGYRENRK